MAVSQHSRFENHMDISSPETMGDAEKINDTYDDDPYDDDFEEKLLAIGDGNSLQEKKTDAASKNEEEETNSYADLLKRDKAEIDREHNEQNPIAPSFPNYADVDEKEMQSNNNLFQKAAEKAVAAAVMVNALETVLSGGSAAIDQANSLNLEDLSAQTSVVSSIGQHDMRSINEAVNDLGFEVGEQDHHGIEDAFIDTAQAIEAVGNDMGNLAEYVAEQSKKYVEDDHSVLRSEAGWDPDKNDSNMDGASAPLVFRAIADANPEYGEGGGTQYFIQGAFELKKNGILEELSAPLILELDEESIYRPEAGMPEYFGPDTELILEDLDKNRSGAEETASNTVDEDELQYLDENTIATEGLTDTKDEFYIDGDERKSHEDFLHPHGNQEDSNGSVFPDNWTNPTELEKGKTYYQLSPMLNTGEYDILSSYFTDQETIDSCKDINGNLSASALFRKLQIAPKSEIIDDETGLKREVYVNRYVLSAFVYRGSL